MYSVEAENPLLVKILLSDPYTAELFYQYMEASEEDKKNYKAVYYFDSKRLDFLYNGVSAKKWVTENKENAKKRALLALPNAS